MINSGTYEGCNKLCAMGEREVFPFIGKRLAQGGCTIARGSAFAIECQKRGIDAFFNSRTNGDLKTFQLKTEEEQKSGNIFYETWSNYTFRVGWGCDVEIADLLGWYFYKPKILWVMLFGPLRKRLFIDPTNPRSFKETFREVSQHKTRQMNDTRGRLVPIEWLKGLPEIQLHRFRIHHGQLELFDE